MSKASWKREFYPISAIKSAKGTELDAAKHSLQKWEGLTKESLQKHGLTRPPLIVDSTTCSLCRVHGYRKLWNRNRLPNCNNCVVSTLDGGLDCDSLGSRYSKYISLKEPEPMIDLLRKAVRHLKLKRLPKWRRHGAAE